MCDQPPFSSHNDFGCVDPIHPVILLQRDVQHQPERASGGLYNVDLKNDHNKAHGKMIKKSRLQRVIHILNLEDFRIMNI
jgi:hypothetical protein